MSFTCYTAQKKKTFQNKNKLATRTKCPVYSAQCVRAQLIAIFGIVKHFCCCCCYCHRQNEWIWQANKEEFRFVFHSIACVHIQYQCWKSVHYVRIVSPFNLRLQVEIVLWQTLFSSQKIYIDKCFMFDQFSPLEFSCINFWIINCNVVGVYWNYLIVQVYTICEIKKKYWIFN